MRDNLHAMMRHGNIVLAAILAFWAHTAFSASVTGTVTDSGGKPVAGATVWLCQDHDVKKAQTGEDGAFSFDNVPGRPVDVVAAREGLALGGASADVPGAAPLTLVLGEPDALTVRVRDSQSQPVEGASVSEMLVNDVLPVPVADLVSAGFPWHRSNPEGVLTFPGLPKGGHVRFNVVHRQYAQQYVPYLPVGGKEQPVILYAGVKVRGRVTNEAGAGISRARVGAFMAGQGERDVVETLTDPDGFYNLTVKPGDIFIGVRHPEYASPEPLTVQAVEAGDTVANVTLPAAHAIRGTVVFPDGTPGVGVPVAYWIEKALYEEVLTQVDGAFLLQTPDTPGVLRITPPPGFMTESLNEIPVTGKLAPEINLEPIKLKPLPAIEGVVTTAEGKGRPRVLISTMGLKPGAWAITGEDGRFRMQLYTLPETETILLRAEDGDAFERAEFTVQAAAPKPVTLVLKPFEADVLVRESIKGRNDLTAMVGKEAPEITCGDWLNGEPVSLAASRGKVTVLLFWAGFDARIEARDVLEELRAVHDLMAPAGDVVFAGIHDGSDEAEQVRAYVKETGLPFPVGRDADGFRSFEAYHITYIPQIVLIDKQGIFRHYQVEGRLLELIKSLRRER